MALRRLYLDFPYNLESPDFKTTDLVFTREWISEFIHGLQLGKLGLTSACSLRQLP